MVSNQPHTYLAPAKINLSLNITGKRDDGYHLLHSITTFANFGDEITITPAGNFSFTQESDFVELAFNDDNLIIKTAHNLAKKLGQELNCHIHLNKKIPIGAGLGGGSSDAATTVKALLHFWNVSIDEKELQDFLLSLGADLPVCYYAKPCIFEGIGEIITPLTDAPEIYTVLIYPNQFCSTPEVFQNFDGQFSSPSSKDVWNHLDKQQNDLTNAAIQNIPEIQTVLDILSAQKNCLFSRMSGSGSCCFGVFPTKEQSEEAFQNIQKENTNWWVQTVILNHNKQR